MSYQFTLPSPARTLIVVSDSNLPFLTLWPESLARVVSPSFETPVTEHALVVFGCEKLPNDVLASDFPIVVVGSLDGVEQYVGCLTSVCST